MSTWVVMPSDDDVIHSYHKYIDKIMGKNGKWRYIYYKNKITSAVTGKVDDVVGKSQKARLKEAKRKTEFYKRAQKGSSEVTQSHASFLNQYGLPRDEELDHYMDWNSYNINELQKAKKNENKEQEAYNKTLLGKIDQVKDAGLKAWDSFTSLFKKEEYPTSGKTITNNSRSKYHLTSDRYQYTPSYSTKNKKSRRR